VEGDLLQSWSRSLASHSRRRHCTGWAVQLQCAARTSCHHTRTVVRGRGVCVIPRLLVTVAERGLVMTPTCPNLQELDRLGAALTCSPCLGLLAGLKQAGRFFILREADHFLDSLLWSLGCSLLLLQPLDFLM